MAIYLVDGTLVKAKNGHHACELAGKANATPQRVVDDADYGVYAFIVPDDQDEPETFGVVDPDEDEEIDITSLSDKNKRTYKNKKTGAERQEER